MAASMEQILEEALNLPDDSKLALAERLVQSVSGNIPPEVEARQMDEVQRRIEDARAGKVQLIDGNSVLAEVRDALERGE